MIDLPECLAWIFSGDARCIVGVDFLRPLSEAEVLQVLKHLVDTFQGTFGSHCI